MQTFGKYTLVEPLGMGGMGEVWRATFQGPAGFEKAVALKRMRSEMGRPSEAQVAMFVQEAKIVAQLSHPNVIQVFDFGCEADDYYLAMEFVRGASLSAVMRRGKMSMEAALTVLLDASRALAYAHAANDANGKPLEIVHRDVTPHNLLVAESGDVKLSDFGIARTAGAISYTAPGSVRGKIGYMSPEQARSETLDGRSDVFTLGIIAWELLGEGVPFTTTTDNEIRRMQEIATFALDEARLTSIPEIARAIVASALAPDRANRLAAKALERAIGATLDAAAIARAREELAARAKEAQLPPPGVTASMIVPPHRASSATADTAIKPVEPPLAPTKPSGPPLHPSAIPPQAPSTGSVTRWLVELFRRLR